MFGQLTITEGQEKSEEGNSRNHSGSSLRCYEGEGKKLSGNTRWMSERLVLQNSYF